MGGSPELPGNGDNKSYFLPSRHYEMKKCSSKAFGLMIGDFQSNALKSRDAPRDQSPNPADLVPNANRANRFAGPKVQIRSKSTFAQIKAN